MRPEHTSEESWVIGLFMDYLAKQDEVWNIDETVTDAPDLVIYDSLGKRVACEIAAVGINEWYRWKNDKKLDLGLDKLDSWVMPREADQWIRNVVAAKAPKVPNYLTNSNCSEAYLLVHAGMSEAHDFFVLEEEDGYDLPLMQEELMRNSGPFQKVFVFSSASKNKVARVYPPISTRPAAPDLSVPNTMKAMNLRSMQVQLNRGVTRMRLSSEFDPDRLRKLPPLDPKRS